MVAAFPFLYAIFVKQESGLHNNLRKGILQDKILEPAVPAQTCYKWKVQVDTNLKLFRVLKNVCHKSVQNMLILKHGHEGVKELYKTHLSCIIKLIKSFYEVRHGFQLECKLERFLPLHTTALKASESKFYNPFYR